MPVSDDSAILELDAAVRRVDPDRWLAARFIADPQSRADVIALYALNHELAHVAHVAHEPLMGEIRLTWWAEAIDEICAGRPPRGHPVLQALARVQARRALPREALAALVEARYADLEPVPLAGDAALESYVRSTAGTLMRLAAAVVAPQGAAADVEPAARAWALAGLWRLRATGVSRLPAHWDRARLVGEVEQALRLARPAARAAPVEAFPCLAYAALAALYAKGRSPSELEKRVRLTAAVLSGRL